jgi:glucose/arabinose dehydrogenase
MTYAHRTALLTVSLGVAALLVSCTPASPQTGPTSTTPPSAAPSVAPSVAPDATDQVPAGSEPRTMATGLDAPWSVVFRAGVTLVSERDSAQILEIAADGTSHVVGIVQGVTSAGEGGLLGLAVDAEGRLYVRSTAAQGNRIQRFTLTEASGSLSLGEAETIVDGIPAASYHDGGRIAFGPDGMLYATAGDAGQQGNAQDLDSLGGKILRMNPDGSAPADNPFPDSLVYSYGHRNPQGLAWDDEGTLYATEFGQNTWDELNIITPGTNYGWPDVEGIADTEGFTDPVQQREPEVASPSGMTHLNGTLYIANLRGQVLRAVPVADLTTSTDYYAGDYGRIRDVTPGPDGNLWMLTSNTDGRGDPTAEDDRLLSITPAAP